MQPPYQLKYELTRKQRLLAHWKVWRPFLPMLVILMGGALLVARFRWWLFPAPLLVLFQSRGFWRGLVDVVICRVRVVDAVIEENGLGVLLGSGERWHVFLDGVLSVRQLVPGLWTIQHRCGWVLHIPVSAITDEQVQHIKDAAARGRTAEGIQAVVERGKILSAMQIADRKIRKGSS